MDAEEGDYCGGVKVGKRGVVKEAKLIFAMGVWLVFDEGAEGVWMGTGDWVLGTS